MDDIFFTSIILATTLMLFMLKNFNCIVIKKKSVLLPKYPFKLFYIDKPQNNKNPSNDGVIYSKKLISKKYKLTGKPDMIYKNSLTHSLIPIELKSGTIGKKTQPREGDLMQLITYFFLIKEEFKRKPKKGLIIYKDYMFVVKNTKKIRLILMNRVNSMRKMLRTGKSVQNKNYNVCNNCICKDIVCHKAK